MNPNYPKHQKCGNCLYYSWAEPDEHRRSACCRFPPRGNHAPADEDDPDGIQATLYESSPVPTTWCGEWAPANPETVDEAARTLARFVILGDLTAARALVDRLKETS